MFSSESDCFSGFVTLYFLFFVSIVLCTLASPTLHYCRHDQRDALLEFQHEFPVNESDSNHDDSSFSSWNKSSDCCSWKGVECDAKYGEVISLSLVDILLNSSLKTNSSLFKLQYLERLIIFKCNLNGKIPSSIGNLSRLTFLSLSGNNLVGQIPVSIGNLSRLTVLALSGNNLVGQIPVSIGNLSRLTDLSLWNNNLVGQIPVSIGNLSLLTYLALSGNNLVGQIPVSIGNLSRLTHLGLWDNNLVGQIPDSIGNLSRLTYLALSGNNLVGQVPVWIGNLSRLTDLDLSDNKLVGQIPVSIGNLSLLTYLALLDNNLVGPVPDSIGNLSRLTYLDLSGNKLVGQVPGFLRRSKIVMLSHNSFSSFGRSWEEPLDDSYTGVEILKLDSNSFQIPFPHWICNFGSLRLLELSNNLFHGVIPPCLRNSTGFPDVLVLRNNSLSGTLPDDIFVNATSLRVLDVSHNQLEGKLPRSLVNCKAMEFLNVESNRIKDEFPSWLGSMPWLYALLLRSCQFYGSLYHPHISNVFQRLRVIDISHNDFTGILPPFFFSNWSEMTFTTLTGGDEGFVIDSQYKDNGSSWYKTSMEMVNKGVEMEFERINTNYKAIDFSGNRLCGNIPESIGLLKGLYLLNLSGNAFTGNIPQSLGNLTKLESLDLSRNQLSGQIPGDLGKLSSLSTMNFSYNNLEGPIPRSTQFQSQQCSSFIGNPKLYGLEEICVKTHVLSPTPQQSEELSEPEEQVINWIAAAIAYGPGVFCGLVIGHIFFASHGYEWFMEKFGRIKRRTAIRSTH